MQWNDVWLVCNSVTFGVGKLMPHHNPQACFTIKYLHRIFLIYTCWLKIMCGSDFRTKEDQINNLELLFILHCTFPFSYSSFISWKPFSPTHIASHIWPTTRSSSYAARWKWYDFVYLRKGISTMLVPATGRVLACFKIKGEKKEERK